MTDLHAVPEPDPRREACLDASDIIGILLNHATCLSDDVRARADKIRQDLALASLPDGCVDYRGHTRADVDAIRRACDQINEYTAEHYVSAELANDISEQTDAIERALDGWSGEAPRRGDPMTLGEAMALVGKTIAYSAGATLDVAADDGGGWPWLFSSRLGCRVRQLGPWLTQWIEIDP